MADALAMVELDSIARGYRVVDVLAKRSPVRVLEANLVEPGRFLILFEGGVAEVEEAYDAAVDTAAAHLVGRILIPFVHPAVVPGLRGVQDAENIDTLVAVESRFVAPSLEACDRALKEADVRLAGLRISPGLGGKAWFALHGVQHDAEAAAEAARRVLEEHGALHCVEVIPRPHEDLLALLLRPAPFALKG